nr:putative ribonuclease H-like domain-containing protein [Tanacetum cinerariifolium]
MNKKHKWGVVVRNKARLVVQGHRQEEGIDYGEVFAHVARIQAIRIFLAFASYMGFIVNQMDVKSAFLYCTVDEEVYVTQPPGFVEPGFPNKVYKVVKVLYGLHQAPRAWYATFSTFLEKSRYRRGAIDKTLFIKQDKKDIMLVQVYVDDIIFSSTKKSWCDEFEDLMKNSVMTASTTIETQKSLVKDKEAADVDYQFDEKDGIRVTTAMHIIIVASYKLLLFSLTKDVAVNLMMLGHKLVLLRYALMVNPTIYVSCIKQFWATVSIKKANNVVKLRAQIDGKRVTVTKGVIRQVLCFDDADGFWATVPIKKANNVVKLRALIDGKRVTVTKGVIRQVLCFDDADGVECLPKEDIFTKLAHMGYEKPPPKLTFYKAFFFAQCRQFNFSKYIFDIMVRNVDSLSKFMMVGKGFSGVETTLFATMLVQPHTKEEEDEEEEVPYAPTPPSPTIKPTPPPQEPIPTPLQAQPVPPLSPPQEHQPDTSESSISIINTLMETSTTLFQKVAHLEQDKISQALEIIKLNKRVKKLEKQRRSKSLGLKRLRNGRKDEDNVVIKEDSDVEPTVFNDEEVTMTIAQTPIKMKAKKARLLDEQMAKRLHDEEVEQVVAREKQEKYDLEKAKVLQKKYQSLKRKPISIAQAKKNMIVYLKNMAGYKMKHFKGMTYDKVRPIFEREYSKVQILFKPNKDVDEEPTMKKVVEKTLLQESFKKLKVVEVLEKDYPLSNGVMTLMLSTRLQVEKDSEMARDLEMKIFMKANQPKSR